MARRSANLTLKVLAEKQVIFDGECDALYVPGTHDSLVVLPMHTPMIAKLGSGEIAVKVNKSRQVVATVESGLLYVGINEATVLVDL